MERNPLESCHGPRVALAVNFRASRHDRIISEVRKMYTFKFEGLTAADAPTPYYYGSLPAQPERGQSLILDGTGNHYVICRVDGEGLTGKDARKNERELAYAEISRGEFVPTIWLQHIGEQTSASGRSLSAEEVKTYSQQNGENRRSASE